MKQLCSGGQWCWCCGTDESEYESGKGYEVNLIALLSKSWSKGLKEDNLPLQNSWLILISKLKPTKFWPSSDNLPIHNTPELKKP